MLRDLGSTNGTTVNGRRVIGAAVVRDGDQISFGHMAFRLAAESAGVRGNATRKSPPRQQVTLPALVLTYSSSRD